MKPPRNKPSSSSIMDSIFNKLTHELGIKDELPIDVEHSKKISPKKTQRKPHFSIENALPNKAANRSLNLHTKKKVTMKNVTYRLRCDVIEILEKLYEEFNDRSPIKLSKGQILELAILRLAHHDVQNLLKSFMDYIK